MTPLTFDPKKTALIVIDLQQGVLAMPTEPRPAAEVLATTMKLAEACRAKGVFVVLVRVEPGADGKDMVRPESDAPSMRLSDMPSNFALLAPGLAAPGDHIVVKKQWGAFYDTDLELQLRRRGIQQIILTGVATAFGVESTARQAYELGFEQVFVEDAMASRGGAEHENAISRIFPRIGRVRKAEEVLRALA